MIYHPESERPNYYADASLSDHYEDFIGFDDTIALTALPAQVSAAEGATYPFGPFREQPAGSQALLSVSNSSHG